MNRIYKVVWSKAKNCYVVASELAKRHTKSPKSSIISRTLIAGVLACVIGVGIVAPVYADSTGDSTFTITVPKGTGAEDVYNFNLSDDLGVAVENSVVSHDGVSIYNTNRNMQTIIEENASRYSNVYEGDGQRGLFDSTNNVWKRDGNYLLYLAHHGGLNNVLGQRDFSTLEDGIDINEVINFLYDNRYASPQQASDLLRQRFGNNNMFSTMLGMLYSDYSAAIRGGTSGLYEDLKELVGTLTYDEHKSDLALAVNNLDVNNAQGNTIVGTGTVTGTNSIAIGAGHQIAGNNSGAFGDPNIVDGSNSYVIGNSSSVNDADTDGSFVMGNNSRTNTSDTVILGNNNNVGGGRTDSSTLSNGFYNYVMGDYNIISGNNNTVLGTNNRLLGQSHAQYQISDEDNAFYSEPLNHNIVVGNYDTINGNDNIILGDNIGYTGNNAIIIGIGSQGVENAVSVGNATTQRQIKYVADGTAATDVSTIQQTGSSLALSGTTLSLQDATGTTLNSVTLPSGGSNSGAVMYDDNDENSPDYHSTITLEEPTVGAGVKITNLADGSIAATSTDAVTGAQLYATNQQINTMQTGISNNASTIAVVQTDVSNLKTNYTTMRSDVNTLQTQVETGFNVNINGAKVKTVNPDSNYINFKSGTNVTLTNDTNSVKIDVPANGTIASGDTGIISGGSVFNETRVASNGNYILAANTASQNLNALDTAVKGLADNAVTYDSTTKKFSDAGTEITDVTMTGTMTAGTVSATSGSIGGLTIASNQISGLGDATLSASSTEAVNGSQLYTTNQNLAQEISDRADADTALSNRIGTVSADGNYITTVNNVSQNLEALDDAVKDNADDIAQINTDLSGKANVALDNIDASGKAVITGLIDVAGGTNVTVTDATDANGKKTYTVSAIGNGTVASGDTGLINGGTLYTEARPASDGNYIATANTVGANLTALDTQVKQNADDIADINTDLNGKANIALDNIDASGKAVITGLTDVAGGTNVTVTNATDANGKKTYTVSATGTGTVASGDTGLITGGTLYTEARPAADGNYIATANTVGANLTALDTQVKANADDIADINTDLTGKANVALDNITVAGETVIKTNAKQAINVVGTNKATVTKTDVSSVDTYTVDVVADGTIAQGNTGLVDGGTVYDALQDQKDEIDDALDTKANKDASNVAANTADWGAAIGTGAVASGNGELVTGGTVYSALQAEARPAQNGNYISTSNTAGANLSALDTAIKAVDDGKANTNLSNITDAGKTVIQDATNVVSGDSIISVTPATANGVKTYTVTANISADGQIADGNTGLVSGDTVFDEVRVTTDGDYVKVNQTTAENLSALDSAVKDNADDIAQINTDLSGKANVDASNLTGHETEWGTAIGTGTVTSGDSELVTGGTVYDALQAETRPASDGNYITTANTAGANLTALDTAVKTNADAITNLTNTKANTDLDNITNNGETVIKNLAKDAVKVVNGTNTTVTEGTDGDAKTYAVNVTVDGQVAEDNTGIVDGGTVYDAIKDAKDDIDDKLDLKANKDASNVAANTAEWGAAIGTGTVTSANGELVTGGTVYDALQAEARPAQDGTYIRTSNTAGANLTALDTAIATLDDGKADTDLGNITDAGKTVIQDATNVVSGDSVINVTSATANGVKTYTVSANISADGTIASGDTGLVSGGTVYTEVRPAQDGNFIETAKTTGENLAALDDAVQDNKNAIDGLDALAVKYDDASKAKITLGGTSGTTIDNVADGTLSATSKEAVNGSQLFTTNENLNQEITDRTNADTALSERIGELASDGQYITTTNNVSQNLSALDDAVKDNADAIADLGNNKANTTLNNITTEGETVIKNLAKDAVKVVAGTHTTVTEGTDGDAKTYAVNVTVDGQVADGNTGIVDGGTVYDAIQDVKNDIDDELDTKANKDASNVAAETAKWGEAIGTGAVADSNGELVTGGTVYSALMNEARPADDGNYIAKDNTAGANLTALDTAVKTNADNIAQINTDLSGKANIALDNINADGKSVITGLTDIAPNDDYLRVVSSTDDAGKKTYNVGLVVNGSIADGNTGLVTGGDVYNAIQASNLTAGDNIEIVEGKINAVGLVKYDDDNKATVTLEGTRGTKLTNLKAAALTRTSSDAVIGAQLFATNTNIEGFARDIRTNSDNITALTTSVTNALNSVSAVSTTVDTVMGLAADKSLNNLSDTGKQVIANAAANAVQEYMRANGGNGGTTGNSLLGGSSGTLNASQPRMFGLMASPAILNAQPTNNDEVVTNNDDLNNDNNTINQATQDALDTKAEIADVEAAFDGVNQKLDEKADITYVDDELAKKADVSYVDDELGKKADKEELDAKADKTELEAKAETDASNIDVAKWSEKLGTGAIAEGDGNLVTGGVVFDAIQNIGGNDMMKVEDNAIRIGGSAKYDAQDTIDVSKSDGTGRVITGVMTDANDPSSAANVGYVNALNENIIQGVNRGFSKLDDKINKTGAGAAALANLHPLDYDPDQKFNISAAYGNYHGTSAGALGVFYRPSEQVMINASSTIGDGNTMFGAGVTFAVDKPVAGGLSKVQMAKTINQQSQVINAQAQELQNVKAELAEIRQMLQEKK